MPIISPNLDDLGYATMRDLLVRRIPTVAPEWTDHNDSDPGIAMIQLFAYLTEQIGFRLNRVPDKNYVEFLRLLGVRLRPAEAAKTRLQLILTKPELAEGFLVPKGARVKGKPVGTAKPPIFETDADLDAVPAQLAALVTTASTDLRDIRVHGEDGSGALTDPEYLAKRFTLVWNGKAPKLKEMPVQPLPVFPGGRTSGQGDLWIGLAFNAAPSAGFLAQRVTLSVQLDDDEQPDPNADVRCRAELDPELRPEEPDLPALPVVEYSYYRPAQITLNEKEGHWKPLDVVLDTTQGWMQSGDVRFDVPVNMGPIPDAEWGDVYAPAPLTLDDICKQAAAGQGGAQPAKPVAHPLVGALKTPVDGLPADVTKVPVSGWIRVHFVGAPTNFFLRALSFNVAAATHAETVRGEVLGRGNGDPGQLFQLSRGNVLAGTLQIAVGDPIDGALHAWTEVESFDDATPSSTVFVLDRESGQVLFGDGIRGMIPADDQPVVALEYRAGGGIAGEVPVATITKMESPPAQVQDAVNVVAALGGKDAETLDEAKARAPKELKVLGRAVTAGDFQYLAAQTPGLRVARVEVVPLRRPYADLIADGPGLDLERERPGSLSVIIVPEAPGAFPTPTVGMLRKVCAWLDQYRLVTTDVHVVPPMYARLFDLCVTVRPKPGVSKTVLRERIATHLENYFHVLTGGAQGSGYPFGGSIHHADLVAQVFAVEGVETVICLEASVDASAPGVGGEAPVEKWRDERRTVKHLTGCIEDEDSDITVVQLAADENVFVDSSNLVVAIEA